MPHDVFISYAHVDRDSAEAVSARLEQDGIRTWMAPRDVLPGANFAESIIEAIEGSRALVLVWTARANASEHVLNEVCHAFDQRISIIPLRLEAVKPVKAMAYYLGRTHWLDALTPPLEEVLTKLSATVRTIVDRQWETIPTEAPAVEPAPPGRLPEKTLPPPPAMAEPVAGWEAVPFPIEAAQPVTTVSGLPPVRPPSRPRRRQSNREWLLAGVGLAAVLLLGGLATAGALLVRGWERVNSERTITSEVIEIPGGMTEESLLPGPVVTDTPGATPSPTATPTRTATKTPTASKTTSTPTVTATATETPAMETAPPVEASPTEGGNGEPPAVEPQPTGP